MPRNLKAVIMGLSFIAIIFIGFFPSQVIRAEENYWPGTSWASTTPEAQNLDSDYLEDMYDFILTNEIYIQSVLIVRNGYIVNEEYLYNSARIPGKEYFDPIDPYDQIRNNKTHAIWSCTKSVTSLLTGIAISEGFISNINEKFFDIFPDKWKPIYGDENKKNITIEHLLTLTAGLEWDEVTDGFSIWPAANYSLDYILNKTLVFEPGSTFEYSTGHVELLATIIQNKTGMLLSEFAQQYLFEPIGINNTQWEWDESAWEWGSGAVQNISHGGFGIFLTPQASARLGMLCLNNGTWNGTQIVPASFVTAATSAQVTEGLLTTDTEYGYLIWLYDNCYAFVGLFGQKIFIVPEYDIVVVFNSYLEALIEYQLKYLLDTYILAAILPPKGIPGFNLFLLLGIISVIMMLMAKKQRI
ncbi:MAG: serine hydrolase domain-containing protein [Promethearchaeota archaeon]